MGVLVRTEPQLCRDLQVEVVVDIGCRDDMSVNVLLTTCDDCSPEVMLPVLGVVALDLVGLSQVHEDILLVLLQVGLLSVGRVALGGDEGIRFEHLAFFGVDRSGGGECGQKQSLVKKTHFGRWFKEISIAVEFLAGFVVVVILWVGVTAVEYLASPSINNW